jgi:hypothetical protein
MNFGVHLPAVGSSTTQLEDSRIVKDDRSLLRPLPPERVGLNGEYDHSGLAKRVMLAFQAQPEAIADSIQVIQRGRVVILVGMVANAQVLTRLVAIALSVSGTDTVETYGVQLKGTVIAESASLR